MKPLPAFFSLFLFIFMTGCSLVEKSIDISSLNGVRDYVDQNFSTGNQDDLRKYISGFSLERDTRPVFLDDINSSKLEKWPLEVPGIENIISERFSFPSLIEIDGRRDTAYFYVYRRGELKGSNVIVWVPGFRVSDFAFRFIKKFFIEGLARGYAIAFYVPPYHLERKLPGREDGDGYFSSDTERNIKLLENMVREIRTIVKYLENRGVAKIGAWGGSMGASSVLVAGSMIKFDHIAVMIPVVDWELVALDNSSLQDIKIRLGKSGFDEELLRRSYSMLSPSKYGLLTSPHRVQILYAKHDQLTPPDAILSYAAARNITELREYPASHATILLYGSVYSDYASFLGRMQ